MTTVIADVEQPVADVGARLLIRRATEADVPTLVAMSLRFLESPDYRSFLVGDPGCLTTLATTWVTHDHMAAWLAERDGVPVGMIGMLSFAHPMSGIRIASEIAWWVDPSARGIGMRLLRVAEQWATDQGAETLVLIAPNARVGAFYEKVGFALVEMSYQRSLR